MCIILSIGIVFIDKLFYDSVLDDVFFFLYIRFEIYYFKFIIEISLLRFFYIYF